jgi:hypothetical protein
MNRRERSFAMALTVTAGLTPQILVAQLPNRSEGPPVPLNTQCRATFASGSGADLIRFCVSKHGNVMRLESPAGIEHVRNGSFNEGYVLCTDGTATRVGFDIGDFEDGFDDGTVSQPGGGGTLPLIVRRNSLDGRFQLIQTFTWDPANLRVKIEMKVKNVSGVKQFNVDLRRVVDLDIAGNVTATFSNQWGESLESVFAWNNLGLVGGGDDPLQQGVSLTAASPKTPHFTEVSGVIESGCFGTGGVPTPNTGDFLGVVTYNIGNIPANQTKTVTYVYERF